MHSPQPPDPLSPALAGWRVAPVRNPEFRSQVWSRLRPDRPALPWRIYARQHAAAVAGGLTLALLAGAFLGHERARTQTAMERAQLATAYVQGLDARSMRMP